jgi:hypothetical protein
MVRKSLMFSSPSTIESLLSTCRPRLISCFAALLVAVDAPPVLAQSGTSGQPAAALVQGEACKELNWRLDGASETASNEADYSPAWAPVLDRIAACGQTLAFTSGCLRIRGHYDTIEFRGAMAIVGGPENAQRLRAASRAERVVRELRDRGVADDVLRWSTASYDFPTYRGASVELEPNCRPLVVAEIAREVAQQMGGHLPPVGSNAAAISEPTQSTVAAVADVPAPREVTGTTASVGLARPAALPLSPSTLQPWIEAAVNVSAIFFTKRWQGEHAFVPEIRLGGGLIIEPMYVRASLSLQSGIAPEQRLGIGGVVAIGYHHSALFNVGLVGSYQASTAYLGDPMLESHWALGAESHQCLFELAGIELCTRQALEFVGGYLQRADVTDGRVETIPPVRSPVLGLSAELLLRKGF